jgi:hypothetical protein
VNRRTTINNVTYVNQRVNDSVTVVSHEAFINSRSAAHNIMRVDQREIAAAPVSHVVAAEPIRTSVFGAGRPAPVKPPSAVISRPVVAVRTPPPPPHPIDQRQAQAGGHLNEQVLVRPVGPAQPAQMNQGGRPAPTQDGFRPFNQPNGGNTQVRQMPQTQPRTYEQQGTPQPENRGAQQPENRGIQQPQNREVQQPENRNMQPQENRSAQPGNRDFRQPQQQQMRQAPQEQMRPAPETHPLVRPTPPVQERNPQQEQQQEQKFNQWHQQQRSAPPPPREPSHSTPPPRQDSSKKGR